MPCPICEKATIHKYRPFCSVECANRDLHNWLHEEYTLESGAIDKIEENSVPEAPFFQTKTDD
jgi:uncharacterized protein